MKKISIYVFIILFVCAALSAADIGRFGEVRPDWTVNGFEDNDNYYAVGFARMSNDQNAIKMATAKARAGLSEIVLGKVYDIVKAEKGEEAADKAVSNGSVLSDVVTYSQWFESEARVYVLVGMPKSKLEAEVNRLVEESGKVKEKKSAAIMEAERITDEAIRKYFEGGK